MTGVTALNGAVLGLLMIAAIMSWPLTWWLLRRYRRTVVRAMQRRSAHATSDWVPAINDVGFTRVPSDADGTVTAADEPSQLTRRAAQASVDDARLLRRDVWRRYALAGCIAATVLTVATFLSAGIEFLPWRTAIVWVVYAWPLVLTAVILSGFNRRTVVRAVMVHFAILLALAAAAGNTMGGVLLWLLMAGPPTAVVAPYLHRSVRAVGVIVVLFVLVGLLGADALVSFVGGSDERIMSVATIASGLGVGGVAAFVALIAIGFLVTSVLAWFGLDRLGHAYREGLPDQLVLIGAVWGVFAAAQGIPLAHESLAWAATTPVAFIAFWLVASRPLGRHRMTAAPRLLVLRIFSLGRQSEDLFRRVVTDWQYVGPVRLIGGPDLARTTVEPDEFLTFAAGKLEQLFIATPEQFEQQRTTTDATRDRHGRYRVQEFLCFDNTWRHVVRGLMRDSDLVLMDVRGFAAGNDGARHELTMLARAGMLERTTLVIDGNTDRELIAAAIVQGGGAVAQATLITPPGDDGVSGTDLVGALPAA